MADRMELGRLDGGLLVGRQLVHACIKDPADFEKTAEVARYSQLLTAKLKLPILEAHRIIMAAWVSALWDEKELIDPLVKHYQLEDLLASPEALGQIDNPNTGIHILSLAMGYQALKEQNPDIQKDLKAIRRSLVSLWALTPERNVILNKFMLILRDEQFLFGLSNRTASVLIVDPAEIISTALTLPLRNQGYDVDAVGNVPDALTALSQEIPDLIIVEARIPIEDGTVLCRRLREKPETESIPIIMMTSSNSQRIARNCLKSGADDIIIRPIDMELLFIRVRKLLEERTSTLTAEGIRGTLRDISATDVIQLLCAGCKSVILTMEQGEEKGFIYIQDGEITEARYSDLIAEDAFYKLMGWKNGTFSAQSCDEYPPRLIHAPAISLLMEAARQNDEGGGAE